MESEESNEARAKEESVHTRDITAGDADPNAQFVRTVANLKRVEETELDPLYPTIDGMVKELFSNPPSAQAQSELTFVFEGFRITVFQDGTAVFQEQPAVSRSNQ